MIVFLSYPKNSTKKLLQLINTFSKVAGYKINSPKVVLLLDTNDKRTPKEIREMTLFTITSILYKMFWWNSNQASEGLV